MTRFVGLLLIVPLFGSAFAADSKPYMKLIGHLVGTIESPRLIHDFCAERSPATAGENSRLFDAWKQRNKELLAVVEAHKARANERMKKEGAPGGDAPMSVVIGNMKRAMEEKMGGMSPEYLDKFCSAFPRLLEQKDEDARSMIPALLADIDKADNELKAQEQ